ncbi:serine/threonine-protein kinase [Nocardia sp. NPDC127526]|uniref:serine/threonine-protein kinase n=1 Tax=Nocardia sp. NPDC127526 TaxID=3345393 RepID=UPI00362D5A45
MRTLGPGSVVAGYRIERLLGTGGAGAVYLARHPRLPRKVALKVLFAEHHTDDGPGFHREAQVAARLDHPNIVAIHDRGVDDDMWWIAMQFVAGYNAAELLGGPGPVPLERVIDIIAGAAAGLDEAHRAGLLHRDVKPANILLEPAAVGPDRVLVTDFGIAGAADDSTSARRSPFSLAYAAPEQIRGDALDRRVDVYALGCTLYHLLTGAVPFPRDSTVAVMHAHMTVPPPRPSAARQGISAALDAVVARAMAKDPAARYDSCGELAEAARTALHAPPVTRGNRIALALAGGATVAVIAVVIAATMRDSGPGAANAPTPSPSAPPPTSAPAPTSAATTSDWGAFGFIVDTFPALLPATPATSGFGGLRCSPTDSAGRVVSTDSAGAEAVLQCSGDSNPVTALRVTCNADRSAFQPPEPTTANEGQETWVRASGSGRSIWGPAPTGSAGRMTISFDAPRNHCVVQLFGGSSGQDLHDRWWPTAPL